MQTGNGATETENPGALAGATGANVNLKETVRRNYRNSRKSAMRDFAQDRHKRAAKMLAYALMLHDARAWLGASFVWGARLGQDELTGLAFAALRALEPEARIAVFNLANWGATEGAGPPSPPWINTMDDARWWAAFASRAELKAYALVSFEAMPPADRAAFLDYIQWKAPA